MSNPFWLNIILEIVKAVIGVAISALTIFLAFYTKRLNEKVKLRSLQNEIDRQTNYASQSRTFASLDFDTKVNAIVDSVEAYAKRNGISISSIEVMLLVENSFTSLKTLENNGLKLYRLKLSKENNDGKVIKK